MRVKKKSIMDLQNKNKARDRCYMRDLLKSNKEPNETYERLKKAVIAMALTVAFILPFFTA